jgi:hypothetical protein
MKEINVCIDLRASRNPKTSRGTSEIPQSQCPSNISCGDGEKIWW